MVKSLLTCSTKNVNEMALRKIALGIARYYKYQQKRRTDVAEDPAASWI
jgi:hypothetical protein